MSVQDPQSKEDLKSEYERRRWIERQRGKYSASRWNGMSERNTVLYCAQLRGLCSSEASTRDRQRTAQLSSISSCSYTGTIWCCICVRACAKLLTMSTSRRLLKQFFYGEDRLSNNERREKVHHRVHFNWEVRTTLMQLLICFASSGAEVEGLRYCTIQITLGC